MSDEMKLMIGLALLGGIGYLVYSNRATALPAIASPQDLGPTDVALPGASNNVVPLVSSPSPATPTEFNKPAATVPAAATKVVPIRPGVTYPKGANPLGADPTAKAAAKAYRVNGVNYWLVTFPDGHRDYYSDAEFSRVSGVKKVV